MSDRRLRALARRWRETGAVSDEAAYLVERVRIGDLDTGALEQAAYLGHPAAVLALGDEAPEVLAADNLPSELLRLDQVGDYLGYLEEVGAWWGPEFCMRFAIAAARYAADRWEARRPQGVESLRQARDCIRRAEAWVREPTRERGFWIGRVTRANNLSESIGGLRRIARLAGRLGGCDAADLSRALARTVLAATRIVVRKSQRPEREALLQRVRDDLVPWALGASDPSRARREPR